MSDEVEREQAPLSPTKTTKKPQTTAVLAERGLRTYLWLLTLPMPDDCD